MNFEYWHRQTSKAPLFPDLEWQKPEQKSYAGKLAIIGGNKLGFAAVAQSYNDSLQAGIGECRAILPDILKKAIDPLALDCVFVPSNPSGGMSRDAADQLQAAAAWGNGLLLIGDTGRNSETAILLEDLLQKTNIPAVITRDALDLLRASLASLVQRPQTTFVASLAQLQRIFQAVYYPKTILFSMPLATLVETLHKFTISYPCSIVVFHQNHLVVAHDGQVSTTPWEDPMMIWRGSVATTVAVYVVHNPTKPFQSLSAAMVAR